MARDFDSYIFRKGVSPNTLSVISSKNRIFAYNASQDLKQGLTQIGVVATFDPSESRTIEAIRGIGFGDHIAELVPGVTEPMTISVTRTALYLSNVYQVFGYKAGVDGIVRSLRHHRWPFDIWQEIVFSTLANRNLNSSNTGPIQEGLVSQIPFDFVEGSESDEGAANAIDLLTIYEACWMADYSVSFASDTAMVQETVTINVSDILAGPDPFSTDKYEGVEPYSVLSVDQPASSGRLKIS